MFEANKRYPGQDSDDSGSEEDEIDEKFIAANA